MAGISDSHPQLPIPSAPVVTSFSLRQESRSRLLGLPAELRLKIYEALLGSGRIHCVSVRNDMGYFECFTPSACECHRRIFPGSDKPFVLWCEAKLLPPNVKRPSLQLLRACRQIYVEAAHLPYTGNEFVLHSIWSLFDIPQDMPSHRVKHIKTLSLVFNFGRVSVIPGTVQRPSHSPSARPTTDGAWKSAWKTIPLHFHGVKYLSVWLEALLIDNLFDDESLSWVEPLLNAKLLPLAQCRVKLTPFEGESTPRALELPALERSIEDMILLPKDS